MQTFEAILSILWIIGNVKYQRLKFWIFLMNRMLRSRGWLRQWICTNDTFMVRIVVKKYIGFIRCPKLRRTFLGIVDINIWDGSRLPKSFLFSLFFYSLSVYKFSDNYMCVGLSDTTDKYAPSAVKQTATARHCSSATYIYTIQRQTYACIVHGAIWGRCRFSAGVESMHAAMNEYMTIYNNNQKKSTI